MANDPGWYPDPWQPARRRWWDGTSWGDHNGTRTSRRSRSSNRRFWIPPPDPRRDWPTSASPACGPSGVSLRCSSPRWQRSPLAADLRFVHRRHPASGRHRQHGTDLDERLAAPQHAGVDPDGARLRRRRHLDLQGSHRRVEPQLPGTAQHHVGDPRVDRARPQLLVPVPVGARLPRARQLRAQDSGALVDVVHRRLVRLGRGRSWSPSSPA